MTRAEYESRCGLCDELIRFGEEIEQYEGEWCHAVCVEEES